MKKTLILLVVFSCIIQNSYAQNTPPLDTTIVLSRDSLLSIINHVELTHKKNLELFQKYESYRKNSIERIEKEARFREMLFGLFIIMTIIIVFGSIIFSAVINKKNKYLLACNHEISQQKEEIQQINEELNTTLQIVEQERQKSDTLLLNILPHSLAVELKEKGFATPQHYDLVSVLFTDFKGFTKAVEHLKPIEVIQELDFCFNQFDEIIEKYGLERIKTIGDAYMAVGGLPLANETNPTDAVRAGLEIQAFMNDLKQQRTAEGKTAWQCRLGIHSGEVIAGVVGTKKFAYDIWGDTVNLASRMESSGEVGKVNISGTTYELVKDVFHCEFRGKIEAKNKGEVEMYFVAAN